MFPEDPVKGYTLFRKLLRHWEQKTKIRFPLNIDKKCNKLIDKFFNLCHTFNKQN